MCVDLSSPVDIRSGRDNTPDSAGQGAVAIGDVLNESK